MEAHHHLWPQARMPADWPGSGGGSNGYRLRELYADLCTGHHVVQTVFLQCGASYRTGGLYNAFKLMVEDLSEADKDTLFSGTARRVYRLPALSRQAAPE